MRHRTPRGILLALLLLLAPSARADDDNGESVPLVARICADGTRCVADECPATCRVDAVYTGTRMDCALALEPLEPYCEIGGVYQPADWSICAAGGCSAISGAEPACQWCRPASVCADGSTCNASGLCTDGSSCLSCLPSLCDDDGDGTPTDACGAGGPGLCADEMTACFHPEKDRVRWRHPARHDLIASPILASCNPELDPFYRDASRYLDCCEPCDPSCDPSCESTSVCERSVGLSPQPVNNYCVFIGSKDKYLFALDEEAAYHPDPAITGAGTEDEPPYASCLWHYQTEGEIWRAAAAPTCDETGLQTPGTSEDDRCDVLVAAKTGFLHKVRRHPEVTTTTGCDDPDNFLTCPMTLDYLPDWSVKLQQSGGVEIRGSLLIPGSAGAETLVDCPSGRSCSLAGGDKTRLIFAGTSRGYRGVQLDVDLASGAAGDYDDIDFAEITTSQDKKVERIGIQSSTGRVFWGFGSSGTDQSGLAAFDVPTVPGAGGTLWEFKRGDAVSGTPSDCLDLNQSGGLDSTGLEFHRATPVLNRNETRVVATNRDAGGEDLSGALIAFDAQTGAVKACHYADQEVPGGPNGTIGIVAPPRHATVTCVAQGDPSPCCTGTPPQGETEEKIDRFLVSTKQPRVLVVDLCADDTFRRKATLDEGFAELRAQPAVATELGTFYMYDNNPAGETIYAFDLIDPKLKWKYASGDPGIHDNAGFCKSGKPTTTPAGGRDCYPAPIPIPVDRALPSLQPFPANECGCVTPQTAGDPFWLEVHPHLATAALESANFAGSEFSVDGQGIGRTGFDCSFGVRWHNETNDVKGHWPCNFLGIGGPIGSTLLPEPNMVEGRNDFVITVRNRFGKEGSTRFTFHFHEDPGDCPVLQGGACVPPS